MLSNTVFTGSVVLFDPINAGGFVEIAALVERFILGTGPFSESVSSSTAQSSLNVHKSSLCFELYAMSLKASLYIFSVPA